MSLQEKNKQLDTKGIPVNSDDVTVKNNSGAASSLTEGVSITKQMSLDTAGRQTSSDHVVKQMIQKNSLHHC